MHLTEQSLESYRRDGYLLHDQRILSHDEIGAVVAEIDMVCRGETNMPTFDIQLETGRSVADEPVTEDNPVRKIQSLSYFRPAIAQLAKDPRIVDLAESILGPDIKLYTDEYFMKNPAREGRPFHPYTWHQDALNYPFAPPDNFVTCWIALDRATPENGCMQFIPGSQHYGPIAVAQREQFVKHPALPQPVHAPCEAGYAVLHHGMNFHCSDPNRSSQPRRALAFHYMSARTLYLGVEDETVRRYIQHDYIGDDFRFMPIRGREYPHCV